MRKQYYFRPTERGVLIWDVDRLVELSREFERRRVPLEAIREIDEAFWMDGRAVTCRELAMHAKLIQEADLSFPIILNADGRVMDGMHRVCKALLKGRADIDAVQFRVDPEPDHIDVAEGDLPYGDSA
jgi:hypothetical protein